MTIDEIRSWLESHGSMRSKLEFYWDGELITFENGDTYERREKVNTWKKTAEIKLNGKLENVTDYTFEGFAWKAVN